MSSAVWIEWILSGLVIQGSFHVVLFLLRDQLGYFSLEDAVLTEDTEVTVEGKQDDESNEVNKKPYIAALSVTKGLEHLGSNQRTKKQWEGVDDTECVIALVIELRVKNLVFAYCDI